MTGPCFAWPPPDSAVALAPENAFNKRAFMCSSFSCSRPVRSRLAHAGAFLVFIALAASLTLAAERKPNVIFLMADDLGYAEIGSYGQKKIRTPNLDRLSAEGIRFTQHYSGSPVCAPSRCILMTGKHPGHAHVRNNRGLPGVEGQEPLPAAEITLAELFKQQGYVTGGFGKWGLGGPGSSGDPLKQGFDRFFGYNDQRHAHNLYPHYLIDDDRRIALNNPEFAAHQDLPAEADPNDPASYERYQGEDYGPDRYSEQALQFIRDNSDRPFFLYYPAIVPHLALQVPDDSLAAYLGKWPDPPYTGGNMYLPHYAPRAAYAAMITRMDREIGRMMALVRELGLEEETLFVFTSDNGPTYDRLGGSDSEFFESAGGFRGYKGSMYEGGLRVPMIVRWKGRIEPGATAGRMTGFEDWMPTLMELIGAPGSVPKTSDGISFAPTLFGKRQAPRPFLYREFPAYTGQQAVWMGNWKGVRRDLLGAAPTIRTELYNLARDPGETQDVASQHPEIVARIEALFRSERVPSAEFPFPALDRPPSE